MSFATAQGVLAGVSYEARGRAHLQHYLIAGVYAVRTADALVLQAVSDIDASRTDLDT